MATTTVQGWGLVSAIALPDRYGMSDERKQRDSEAGGVQEVEESVTGSCLRARYSMSGAELAVPYAMSGTDLAAAARKQKRRRDFARGPEPS
eukprot:3201142-Rhodomonas_salina.3